MRERRCSLCVHSNLGDVDLRGCRPPWATVTVQTTLALYTGDPRLAARLAMGHARSATTEPKWATVELLLTDDDDIASRVCSDHAAVWQSTRGRD